MKNKNYMSNCFQRIAGIFQKNNILRNSKVLFCYIDNILLFFIKKPKQTKKERQKILIIYNLAFGDNVIFRCSADNYRKIYPKDKYELNFVCQKGIDKLYVEDDIFDNIIPIDFNKSTINLKTRFKNFKLLRKEYYDIVIDPVGIFEWTTNIFYTRVIKATKKIGVVDENLKQYCNMNKINKIYDELIKVDKPNISLIEYYNVITNKLANKEIFITKIKKLNIVKPKIKLPKKYFVIFPSASMKLKRWPIDRYAELAKRIYNKTNYELLLVGTSSDSEALNEFKSIVDIPYIDMIGKTSLNDYIYIIKNAKLLVTNDTSAYHIGVIEETPTAIITGVYTYERYVLYEFKNNDKYRKPCIVVKLRKCKNCSNRCKYLEKGMETWPCLNDITIDYAWNKISKYIDTIEEKK